MNYKIFPLGENALTVDFGNVISPEINDRVLNLAAAINQNPFPGLVEIIPAFSSLTVFYNLAEARKAFAGDETVFAGIKNWAKKLVVQPNSDDAPNDSRFVEIPVCYDEEFAPDLDFVAARNNLTAPEVVEIHASRVYRVFMLGFLPGFPYLGEVDSRIHAPRLSAPRVRVPAGSIGIAGVQTGIYPLASPGGWQIIGRTPLALFAPQAEIPVLLQTGDRVRFRAIDRRDFESYGEN